MSERGQIFAVKRAQQINDFQHLQFGKITPTDLDGCIEYHNKAYIFIEVKYKDKELPYGQRLAIERLVKDTATCKKSMAIVCEHYVDNTDSEVDVASCRVRELYMSPENKWRPPKESITVRQLIELFIDLVERRLP